jgi:hypothetical protein
MRGADRKQGYRCRVCRRVWCAYMKRVKWSEAYLRSLISRSRWKHAQHVKMQKSACRDEGEEVCTGVTTRDRGKVRDN